VTEEDLKGKNAVFTNPVDNARMSFEAKNVIST
jgi:hypothetical protein